MYFLISLNYGNKIKRMLKGNTKDAEESQELKKIKRFMRVCMSMYFFISFGRVTSILTACVFTDDERCRTNNVSIPPCDYIPQWWAIAGPWIGGWAILYANQPGKKKVSERSERDLPCGRRKTRTHKRRRATAKLTLFHSVHHKTD